MDPTATPAANAGVIAADVQSACSTAQVTYPRNAAYLTVDFGAARTLTDTSVAVSGVVQIGVTGDGVSAPLAALQIRDVEVAGSTLNGFANVASTEASLSIATRVAVAGVGDMAFNGTSKWRTTAARRCLCSTAPACLRDRIHDADEQRWRQLRFIRPELHRFSRDAADALAVLRGQGQPRRAHGVRVPRGGGCARRRRLHDQVSFANVKFDSATATSGAAAFASRCRTACR